MTHRRTGPFGAVAIPSGLIAAALLLLPAAPTQAAELVMFDAPGCEWCAAWERDVGTIYDKTAEGRAAPLRRVPRAGPWPDDLAALAAVVYTPTFVLVDDGVERGRILGYPGEDHFWGLLGEMQRRLKSAPAS